jgi:hypothetical protein
MNWLAWFFIGFGFAMVAAATSWEWFMTHRKARLFVKLFGRNGARAFYFILGGALVAFGVCELLGIIDFAKGK